MAPPATGAARRATAAPQRPSSSRRPALRVFEPQPRRSTRRGLSRRGHLWIAALLVVGSLLAVVVADTMVAQGQVRLAHLESRIAAQQAMQKSAQTAVAQLAAPERVVAQGIALGLTAPAQVVDLPQVPLDVPLPVPNTTPLPGSAAARAAAAAAAAAAVQAKAAAAAQAKAAATAKAKATSPAPAAPAATSGHPAASSATAPTAAAR